MKREIYQIKKITGSVFLGLTLIVGSNSEAFAQNKHTSSTFATADELPKPRFQNEMGTFSVDFTNLNVNKDVLINDINKYFNLDDNNQFKLREEVTDDLGIITYKYEHYYKDILIDGDLVFVEVKNNKLLFVSGQVVTPTDLSTTATVSEEEIKEAVFKFIGVKDNVDFGTIKQIFTKIEDNETVQLKLVKKFSVHVPMPFKNIEIFIDAQSGEIVKSFNKVHKVDTASTSATFFRGNQGITVDSYNGMYRLKDNARNIHTRNGAGWNGTLDVGTGQFGGTITEYTNASANFTSSPMKPPVEIHWGMSKTYDYYKNIHNRTSYDNKGSIIYNYYLGTATNAGLDEVQANAGAIDENGVVGMIYGNGKADIGNGMVQVFNPMVALDVAGHEFSHLVISRTANLDYLNESGALNESFADMFGVAIEFYTNLNPNWTMGEGLVNMTNLISPNYLRSLSDPNSGPAAVSSQQPDTYKGRYWHNYVTQPNVDNGGVHINSGVGNYWFYLLSVGGSGTNDINKKYYVSGITIKKAEKIAYRALTNGLTNTATFLDAYNATKNAAAALYGPNSNEWNQVVNAWFAVGIGNAPASNQNIEMQTKLSIYPNPVKEGIVTIDSSLEAATTVEMFDLSGKKVMNAVDLEFKTTLNVSHLATGMYLLKFTSDNGVYTHKIMVN